MIGWRELRQRRFRAGRLELQLHSGNRMSASRGLPNNFGPTLLIVLGACMTPLLIGVPIVLFALAQLRTREGHRTYGHLLPTLRFGRGTLLR